MPNKAAFLDENGIHYIPSVGSKIRSLLNGVKQTAPHFAKMYGLDLHELNAVLDGEKAPTAQIREAIEKHGPLRMRDLYPKEYWGRFPIPDDTRDGVVICQASETSASERNTERGPAEDKMPFYTYADTAMSKTSLFRPEWIKELYVDNGSDPERTPDWAFNKGHFEHQMTYFIGPVNFHWVAQGKKYVRQMNTGDVNYITPFVPHTFSTREEGAGLILAVTYGGAIAHEEYQARIQRLSLQEYIRDTEQYSVEDNAALLPTDDLGGVIIRRHPGTVSQKVCLLSGIPFQPGTGAYEYMLDAGVAVSEKLIDTERWSYNIGNTPVRLAWGVHTEDLAPGDSFFVRPGVKHEFIGSGRLLVMEINSRIGSAEGEVSLIRKYASLRGVERVHSEHTQWF